MRVALVYPEVMDLARFKERRKEFPPFGPMYLAAVMERAGHEVELFKASPGTTRFNFQSFDAVGFSISASATYGTLLRIRRNSTFSEGALLMAGGVHANFFPERTLIDFDVDGRSVDSSRCRSRRDRFSDIDGGSVQAGFDVRGVEFLDHLHARPTILRDLIDVRALHKTHADIGMAEAIRGARPALPICLEVGRPENFVEQLGLPVREEAIGGLGRRSTRFLSSVVPLALLDLLLCRSIIHVAVADALKRTNRVARTLAVPRAAFTPNFDFKDAFAGRLVVHDLDVPILQARRLIGPKARVRHEEHVVVELGRGLAPVVVLVIGASASGPVPYRHDGIVVAMSKPSLFALLTYLQTLLFLLLISISFVGETSLYAIPAVVGGTAVLFLIPSILLFLWGRTILATDKRAWIRVTVYVTVIPIILSVVVAFSIAVVLISPPGVS